MKIYHCKYAEWKHVQFIRYIFVPISHMQFTRGICCSLYTLDMWTVYRDPINMSYLQPSGYGFFLDLFKLWVVLITNVDVSWAGNDISFPSQRAMLSNQCPPTSNSLSFQFPRKLEEVLLLYFMLIEWPLFLYYSWPNTLAVNFFLQ